MKVEAKKHLPTEQPLLFPILMQSTIDADLIVLFNAVAEGTVLQSDTEHYVGEYYCNWSKCTGIDWQKFEGTIELSN